MTAAFRSPRCGFSLLELALAIGLSVTLVILLGGAMELHLGRYEATRAALERAQLVRSLMDRIADDLRAATAAPPQDVAPLMAAVESSAAFDVDRVDQTQAAATAQASPFRTPGVYGSAGEITIDRPRVALAVATAEGAATPTARLDAGWSRVRYAMSTDAAATGLVRTEDPWDPAVWRAEQGETAASVPPTAPEVVAFSVRYFDGQQALDAWDMAQQEALPLAVEVTLELEPLVEDAARGVSAAELSTETFRRLVSLRAAAVENQRLGSAKSEAAGATTAAGGL